MARPVVDRDQTCPFLLRTFIKVGGFHPISRFEDGQFPVADEQQIFTWKDATLRELVIALRALPPNALTGTLRHPAARLNFRVIFNDPTDRSRVAYKDIGMIHARDLVSISTPNGAMADSAGPDADQDFEQTLASVDPSLVNSMSDKERRLAASERTLDELQITTGDFLSINLVLPNRVTQPEINIRGSAASTGWGSTPSLGGGVGGPGRGRDPLLQMNWRGGAPRGGGPGLGRGGGPANGIGLPERSGGFERGRGGRGGPTSLNRRGGPRRPSPDRTLGGTGEYDRSGVGRRNQSQSRSRSRSRSPYRPRSHSRSRSPVRRGNRDRSPLDRSGTPSSTSRSPGRVPPPRR